jgi:hypothetical protein
MYLDLAGVEFVEDAERAAARALAHSPRASRQLADVAETSETGAMTEPSETSLLTKAKRADMPIWLTYALIFLGSWFILLPAGLALGVWYFYGFGLVLTVVVGLLTRRYYRQVTLEQGEGYSVIRLEYLPWLNRARARSRATGDIE